MQNNFDLSKFLRNNTLLTESSKLREAGPQTPEEKAAERAEDLAYHEKLHGPSPKSKKDDDDYHQNYYANQAAEWERSGGGAGIIRAHGNMEEKIDYSDLGGDTLAGSFGTGTDREVIEVATNIDSMLKGNFNGDMDELIGEIMVLCQVYAQNLDQGSDW